MGRCEWEALTAVVIPSPLMPEVALQQFLEVPSYTEVNPDENALLRCRVSNKRGACSWLRNNKPVGMHRGKYEWATPRTKMNGDCTILIRGAKLHMDNGNWQCQVTHSSFDMQDALSSPPAALVVRAEPESPGILFNGTLVEPNQKIMLSAGARATVVCEVRYGNPPAHVEWYLDSGRLTPLSQTNTSEIEKPDVWTTRSILEIGATRFGYGKQLACRAYHPSYPVPHYRNAYALLDVTYVPLVSIIGAEKKVLANLEEGISILSLECKADGNPAPSVWWTKDGQEIMSNGSHLLIVPVMRKHSGIYGCQAKNDLGTSESVKTDIDVKYPPRVIWVGPELRLDVDLYSQTTFECIADGNPTPSYQWYHCPRTMDTNMCLDGYIIASEAHLSLCNVTYSHRGSYVCIVKNLIGTKESQMPRKKSNLNNASTREARCKRIKRAHQLAEQIESRNLAQRISTAEGHAQESQEQFKCHRKNLTSTTRAAKGRDANVLKELSNYQNKSKQEMQLKESGLQKVVHENLENSVTNVCDRILRELEWHENET
ncbi:irregular chiasm C-roughest protein-like [Battus philenor]|uniref:irregular chiasm C-roughest protein-like n=1 Tax=Battus philenor TaxID=42288 RepID=UPI0035D0B00E